MTTTTRTPRVPLQTGPRAGQARIEPLTSEPCRLTKIVDLFLPDAGHPDQSHLVLRDARTDEPAGKLPLKELMRPFPAIETIAGTGFPPGQSREAARALWSLRRQAAEALIACGMPILVLPGRDDTSTRPASIYSAFSVDDAGERGRVRVLGPGDSFKLLEHVRKHLHTPAAVAQWRSAVQRDQLLKSITLAALMCARSLRRQYAGASPPRKPPTGARWPLVEAYVTLGHAVLMDPCSQRLHLHYDGGAPEVLPHVDRDLWVRLMADVPGIRLRAGGETLQTVGPGLVGRRGHRPGTSQARGAASAAPGVRVVAVSANRSDDVLRWITTHAGYIDLVGKYRQARGLAGLHVALHGGDLVTRSTDAVAD